MKSDKENAHNEQGYSPVIPVKGLKAAYFWRAVHFLSFITKSYVDYGKAFTGINDTYV